MLNKFLDLDGLGAFADVLQVLNYVENLKQTSNDKILKELEHQDNEYLERILSNQKEILELLRGLTSYILAPHPNPLPNGAREKERKG